MSARKVYFRADADQKIGYGHFIRCLALANMLNDLFDCVFYTQEPTEFQTKEVKKVCKLRQLPSDNRKFDLFLDELHGDEIVVLDNYFFSSKYQLAIKQKGCSLVVLGSNDRHYYSDVVINFTNLKPYQFSIESYTKLCLGLNWILLRAPFYRCYQGNKLPHSYSICIGGTDQFCYAEKFLSHIYEIDNDANVTIISTDRIGSERINRLRALDADVRINLSADQMASQFSQSETAIVSSSGVAIEALSQHANVITGYYVDNQINIYNTIVNEDLVWALGDFSDTQVLNRLTQAIHQIQSGKTKQKFQAEDTIDKYCKLFLSL